MTHPRVVLELLEVFEEDGEYDVTYQDGSFRFDQNNQPYARWTVSPEELSRRNRSNTRASRDAWGDRKASGSYLVITHIYENLHTESAGPHSPGKWEFFGGEQAEQA